MLSNLAACFPGGNLAKLELIKRQANAIIKYAGMVRFSLSVVTLPFMLADVTELIA